MAYLIHIYFSSVAASTARCVMFFNHGHTSTAKGKSSLEDYTCKCSYWSDKACSHADRFLTSDYLGVDTIWTIAECALGIISASLPTFGRYLTAWRINFNLKAFAGTLCIRFSRSASKETTPSSLELRFARTHGNTPTASNSHSSVGTEQSSNRDAKLQQRQDGIRVSKSWDISETVV